MNLPPPRSILITGASSGIGEALARLYAAPGITLALTGRDRARLDAVAADLRARGAAVLAETVDVADAAALADFVARADQAAALDLVVANAGIGLGRPDPAGLDAHVRATFAVNVDGVFNTIHPAITLMAGRGRGQVALVASIAGYRGLPTAPAYAASKAAVKAYGEGLRPWLRVHGIAVSVINPGFVVSRMTARNAFPMPFLMSADKAAVIIRDGLARNRGRIAFPWPMAVMGWLLAAAPQGLLDLITARMPAKR